MIQLNKINVQNIIVVSGDADFIPAVKYVKESGSRVCVVRSKRLQRRIGEVQRCTISYR
jgi:uncharacterized LabA/DUF88 family protein